MEGERHMQGRRRTRRLLGRQLQELQLLRAEERRTGAFRRHCCHRLDGVSGKLNV